MELITQKEAIEILGVSKPTFRVMIVEGQVRPVMIGRRAKYRRQEIEDLARGIDGD